MQVSDRRLIMPEFPTTSLLFAFRSIIDHHLYHIHVSVRKPYVLCKRSAGRGSEHRIEYRGSRMSLTVPHSQVWARSMTNVLGMGSEFPVAFPMNMEIEMICVSYHPNLCQSNRHTASSLPCSTQTC